MQLSKHFALDELVFSQTAARLGIDNLPNAQVLANLRHLAAQLELVRSALGNAALVISSGYRCAALNAAVHGARNSAHLTGLAVDFTAPRFGTVLETARAVAACQVPFDQVIYEFGSWVHLGVCPPGGKPKAELLSIAQAGQYRTGLLA